MAISGLQEVLPPSLTSVSPPPPLFDGTTRLYVNYSCPFAQRVWITRNYKGLQDKIKLVAIDLQDRPAWYKEKVYPENKVPSLEHNGKVLGESLDLIKYVDSNFEGPSLFPTDPVKSEFGEQLISHVDTFVKEGFSSFKAADPVQQTSPGYDYLENALGKFNDGPFFLGQFSWVDIAYVPFVERFQIVFSEAFKHDITEGRPKLAAWIEKMETTQETAFKVMNQDFIKLDRFDGINFSRWKDKMLFLLTAMKISYLLDPTLAPLPSARDYDSEQTKVECKKRAEDEVLCRGHILNTLSNRLYDLYVSPTLPKEIWDALEAKYNAKKQGTDKFLLMQYFDYKLNDSVPVLDQLHDLQILVSKLKDIKVDIPEVVQVEGIIVKLPHTWHDYRKKLLHTIESFTLDQILKHIRIEQETRILQSKHSESEPKVNFVDARTNNQNQSGNNKRKNPEPKNPNFGKQYKTSKSCFHYGKRGHLEKDCRYRKKIKSEHTNTANMVETETNEIIAMVFESGISMISEVNEAAATKSFDWWYDSCATIHVCHDRNQFMTYKVAEQGHEVLMGNGTLAKVLGKGNVALQFIYGKKLILQNVLHVPEIKKNLVSANLLCKMGLKAVLESDKIEISKNGVVVGKGYSCDGMFKLRINNKNFVSIYIVEQSYSLWHSRLGHVNHKTIKYMLKHGIIQFQDDPNSKCEICV